MEKEDYKGDISKRKENPQVDEASPSKFDVSPSISAFEVFEKCIKRAENLISFQSSTDNIKEISDQHYCDCYRAAIVLTISALDAFVRKIVISKIVANLAEKNPLNPKLGEYIKGLLNQDRLLDAARNYNLIEKVEEAVKQDFETKSFQGEWKITHFMEMLGYKDIFSEVASEANINEKNLKRQLNTFTNRRHIIAHSGDFDLNQNPPEEKSIDKRFAVECVKTVRQFAESINKIIEEK